MPIWCGRTKPLLDVEGGGKAFEVWRNGVRKNPVSTSSLVEPEDGPIRWGDLSTASVKLAYLLLRDGLRNPKEALTWCEAYCGEVVSVLGDEWVITTEDVFNWFCTGKPCLAKNGGALE